MAQEVVEEEGQNNKFKVRITDGSKVSEFEFEAPSKHYSVHWMRMVSQLPLLLEKITPASMELLNMRKTLLSTIVNDSDDLLACDATSGPIQVDLPLAVNGCRELTFVKLDNSANAVTISTGGIDTIEGETSITLTTQYAKALLISDGDTTWLKYV